MSPLVDRVALGLGAERLLRGKENWREELPCTPRMKELVRRIVLPMLEALS